MRLFPLLVGVSFLNYFDRYLLPPVLGPLAEEFGLSDAQLGWLGSLFLLTYMVASPLVGSFAGRFSRTKLLGAAVALWSLATLATGMATGWWGLMVTRALVGVGEAAAVTLGPVLVCDLFPPEARTRKFTLLFLAIPVGSAAGFGFSGACHEFLGWRTGFLIAGAAGLGLAALMARAQDPVPGDPGQRTSWTPRLLGELLTHRVWAGLTASTAAYTFAMGALTHWVPSLIQREYGVGAGGAGLVFGVLAAVAGILGTCAGGMWGRRYPLTLSALGLLGGGALLALALGSRLGLGPTYGLFGCALLCLFLPTTPVNALTVTCLPPRLRALGSGLGVFLIHALGDAVSPWLVGILSETRGGTGDALRGALGITPWAAVASGLLLWAAWVPSGEKVESQGRGR